MSSLSVPTPGDPPRRQPVPLPAVPALAVGAARGAWLSEEGEIDCSPLSELRRRIHRGTPILMCHGAWTASRLGLEEIAGFDVLELFAFTHPGQFCAPTPLGLADALGLEQPASFEDWPLTLIDSARALLTDLQRREKSDDLLSIAAVMGLQGKGWAWTPYVFRALGHTYDPSAAPPGRDALEVWRTLPEWSEDAPPPPPAAFPVTGEESRDQLRLLLAADGKAVEERPAQMDYATRLTAAFRPADAPDSPHVVLAEAGTGTGKTLGYLAPASVWARKNAGSVWISTYTRNLQRQIARDLTRLYPDPQIRALRTAIRKGRENYLCLLNLEEVAKGAMLARSPRQAIAAGLMARWVSVTPDGDFTGESFPGWLPGLLGISRTLGLSDRRGECIHAGCDHYHRCFVERSIRGARRADLVVANHALVLVQAAMAGPDATLPERYVFDEGHHLFEAADSAFSCHLTGAEMQELRRWILGADENGGRSRARGLKKRLEDLASGDDARARIDAIRAAAQALAAEGWLARLKSGEPHGPGEAFLTAVHAQVMARAQDSSAGYALEADARPALDSVREAAAELKDALIRLRAPMQKLASLLRARLSEEAEDLSSDWRKRLEAAAFGLEERGSGLVGGWIDLLESLISGQDPDGFADWMEIERIDSAPVDIGVHRHWIDPMAPFAKVMAQHAKGMVVTSATLTSGMESDGQPDWGSARIRTGTRHFREEPERLSLPSPYDYPGHTRVLLVQDVSRTDPDQVAAAFRTLFVASGGGGLGLFTAISRLRAVHKRISAPLEDAGLRLYAQHVDGLDAGSLVDVFREDTNACLLGTDAMRDGVDVPGDSLRLIVFDRIPWARPTILHRARRAEFGGRAYDDMITRLRLKQAYGRLIRRASDRGIFVLLEPGLPSRLLDAFPEGVPVHRLGLTEAAQEIKSFFEN